MKNKEPLTYEWFLNLTDKEIVDITLLEVSHVESKLPKHILCLLAALAKRVKENED
jgi:hypothetical protein